MTDKPDYTTMSGETDYDAEWAAWAEEVVTSWIGPPVMPDKTIDYTTMSGAEFKRAVGTDPEKWATALLQTTATAIPGSESGRIALVADWFRDAMDAAVRAQGHLLNWDKPDE